MRSGLHLVIKVDAHTTSIAILNEDQLQLFRLSQNHAESRLPATTGGGSLSLRGVFQARDR